MLVMFLKRNLAFSFTPTINFAMASGPQKRVKNQAPITVADSSTPSNHISLEHQQQQQQQ